MSNPWPTEIFWKALDATDPAFDDVAHAVRWAQNANEPPCAPHDTYNVVYIPPGEWSLSTPIEITTNNLVLQGAGPKTVLTYAGNLEAAIRVGTESDLTRQVRLADLTVRRSGGSAKGGVLILNGRGVQVERVHSNLWGLEGDPTGSYGFKVLRIGEHNPIPGRVVFTQCGSDQCMHGVVLGERPDAGVDHKPLQRCALWGGGFRGVAKVADTADGGGTHQLIDEDKNFVQLGVVAGDLVFNETTDAWGQVVGFETTGLGSANNTLVLKEPGWQDGERNTCLEGDEYSVHWQPGSRGVLIQNAKNTLVMGGVFAVYEGGVYVASSYTGDRPAQTHFGQFVGLKFDEIDLGLQIAYDTTPGGNGERPRQTQVVAVTRARPDSSYSLVVDEGQDTLLVAHQMAELPARVGIGWGAEERLEDDQLLWKISGDVLRLTDTGLLDAAVPQAAGCGVRTFNTGGAFNQVALEIAFGYPPNGFVGVYTHDDTHYLVTKIGGVWYSSSLAQVPSPT